jgi:hypothetical protein
MTSRFFTSRKFNSNLHENRFSDAICKWSNREALELNIVQKNFVIWPWSCLSNPLRFLAVSHRRMASVRVKNSASDKTDFLIHLSDVKVAGNLTNIQFPCGLALHVIDEYE